MPRWLAAATIALVVSATAYVNAQGEAAVLRIDGRDLGGARTDLVSGVAYAPLDSIAVGLGARLAAPVGGNTAALTLGGHVVVLDVVEQGTNPQRPGSVRRDGAPLADLAAVRGDDAVWGPVAAIVRAFGADVAFLSEERAVVVVSSRPDVDVGALTRSGEVETLRLSLSAPAAIQRYDDPTIGRTELLVRRARLARARTVHGEWMQRVDLIPEGDGVRIRIDAPGTELEVIALPDGSGTDLRIRARLRDETAQPADRERDTRVVLDPGFATVPPEWRGPLLEVARELAERLRREGMEVETIRDGATSVRPERRIQAAAGADLVIVLGVAELAAGEVRLWVLGEAAEEAVLEMAVRRNALLALPDADDGGEATDALRRELLLGLVPDLAVGRRSADALASALFQVGGFRAGSVEEAPLSVLAPAAGRGVLIELSAADMGEAALVDALAQAISSVASGAR